MLANLSVIIPCYDCADTISRAVDSIVDQSLLPKEIILVDDASSDEGKTGVVLLAIQKKYQNIFAIKVIRLQENVGAGEARNAGWEQASGDYVAFLDADDTWHPDKLKIQYNWMIDHPSCVLSGHQCFVWSGEHLRIDGTLIVKKISKLDILKGNPFSTPTVMINRGLSLRFQKGKRYAEDYLLWQEVFFEGGTLVKIELPLANVHKGFYGAGGLSSSLWSMEKGELGSFLHIWKKGYLSILELFVGTVFSIFKFFRRVVVIALSRVKK